MNGTIPNEHFPLLLYEMNSNTTTVRYYYYDDILLTIQYTIPKYLSSLFIRTNLDSHLDYYAHISCMLSNFHHSSL